MLTHNPGSRAGQCAGAVLDCADLPAQTLTQGLLLCPALQDRLSNSLQPSHKNCTNVFLNRKGDCSFSFSHVIALHPGRIWYGVTTKFQTANVYLLHEMYTIYTYFLFCKSNNHTVLRLLWLCLQHLIKLSASLWGLNIHTDINCVNSLRI